MAPSTFVDHRRHRTSRSDSNTFTRSSNALAPRTRRCLMPTTSLAKPLFDVPGYQETITVTRNHGPTNFHSCHRTSHDSSPVARSSAHVEHGEVTRPATNQATPLFNVPGYHETIPPESTIALATCELRLATLCTQSHRGTPTLTRGQNTQRS